MKIILLTTQTIHHAFFLKKLVELYPSVYCIIEATGVNPTFDIAHPFEVQREYYELNFVGNDIQLKDLCPCIEVDNINDDSVLNFINDIKPDILISFGTRKIGCKLVSKYKNKLINLHGGDPESYRGLDTHLWAIYHNDWPALLTTIHIVNEALDDGLIIQKSSLDIRDLSHLYELRLANTKACIDLSISAIKTYEALGTFITSKQQKKGRYYSFMPTVLKEICVKKFEDHLVKINKNEN